MSASIDEQGRQLRERGSAVMPGLYPATRVERLRASLLALYERLGEPPLYAREPVWLTGDLEVSSTGLVVHKLLGFDPSLHRDILEPDLVAVVRRALGEDMRLEFVGAVIADRTRPFFAWHNHVGGIDDEAFRRRGLRPPIARPERVAALVYLDEIGPDSGQLLIWPHRLDGSAAPPLPIDLSEWPGQHAVRGPAGTVALLDQCAWHAVRPRTVAGLRLFVGLWFAAADARPAERVDESLRALADVDPLLRSLLPRGEHA